MPLPSEQTEPAAAKRTEPKPKRGLTPDEEREALRLASVGVFGDKRKREAWSRWLILTEAHESLVLEKIDRTYCDKETKEQLAKWVDVSQNVALDISDAICVVWDKPATRTLGKPPEPEPAPAPEPEAPAIAEPETADEDEPPAKKPAAPPFGKAPVPAAGPPALPPKPPAPKPKAKDNDETIALRKLYGELELDSWLQDLNKAAWLLTEAVVVLSIVGGKMRSTILLPFFYDVIDDPDDPGGEPLAYVYRLRREDHLLDANDPGDTQYLNRQGDVVILDSKSWRIYPSGASDPAQEHKTLPHPLGYVPAVPLRFSRPLNGERWGDFRKHRRLIDSTLAVSMIGTQLEFVRKAQNKFLLLAIGDIGDGDDGETNDPERGRAIATKAPGLVDVKALPFDTAPDNFIKDIARIYGNAARAYGGQASESLGEGGSASPTISWSHEAQTEIRGDQITYARKFELRFAEVACDMAKKANHELGPDLPELEEVRETFSVRFAPLSRKYANPSDEQTHFDFLKANGVASPYDLARREDPDLTLEQARDHVMARLGETAEVNAFAADRNMPMDGTGVQSVPEALGKFGPVAKAGKHNEEPGADAPAEDE